jgi:V8-like Glu-specific endopeptidase
VVNSENKSMVWTAGHCVHSGSGGLYHSNVIFVPAYKDGSAPIGRWAAQILRTTPAWASSSDFNYDLGAIVVKPSSNGTRLANRVGSLGLGWNRAYDQSWKSTGYPAEYPFNGERMFRCNASTGTLDGSMGYPKTMGIGCNMTRGASGGGWAMGLTASGGTVASVNSYKYDTQPQAMYGPYQGSAAADLYNGLRYR